MYIETVPNRNSPPAILLRESYREAGKVRKRTLANLSALPGEVIEGLRVLLRGGVALGSPDEAVVIERSLAHGHVAAVLGVARQCGVEGWFAGAPSALRPLLLGLVVARVIEPGSKLATQRLLHADTASCSLGRVLGVENVGVEQLYAALDWLAQAQGRIERRLVRKHLKDATLVLYDLTSTWVTGRCCVLAAHGYSRDGKRGEEQIVFGLICTEDGCPVAVEVFPGNTADPATVAAQVAKLRERYGIAQVAWVGDRGMLTQARIEQVLRPHGLDWISTLRAPQIRALAEEQGPFQQSLFDERDLLELTSELFPGERLVVYGPPRGRNPLLAEERARKREDLLAATERELAKLEAATTRTRRPLRGVEAIALRAGKLLDRFKMAKHFDFEITDTGFTWQRKAASIAQEAALDGLYVVRTSLDAESLSAEQTVAAYKSLTLVERAFRSLKTMALQVRPIFHWNAERVRAHVFLCMLAYYVQWQLREKLKPLLFDDQDPPPRAVRKAERSEAAKAKDRTRQTDEGLPVHSLRTLLADLATLTYNVCSTPINPAATFITTTRPTPLQAKAFELLGVNPGRTQ